MSIRAAGGLFALLLLAAGCRLLREPTAPELVESEFSQFTLCVRTPEGAPLRGASLLLTSDYSPSESFFWSASLELSEQGCGSFELPLGATLYVRLERWDRTMFLYMFPPIALDRTTIELTVDARPLQVQLVGDWPAEFEENVRVECRCTPRPADSAYVSGSERLDESRSARFLVESRSLCSLKLYSITSPSSFSWGIEASELPPLVELPFPFVPVDLTVNFSRVEASIPSLYFEVHSVGNLDRGRSFELRETTSWPVRIYAPPGLVRFFLPRRFVDSPILLPQQLYREISAGQQLSLELGPHVVDFEISDAQGTPSNEASINLSLGERAFWTAVLDEFGRARVHLFPGEYYLGIVDVERDLELRKPLHVDGDALFRFQLQPE